MSQADLDINRDVRKVMVRHWIDLGKLSCRSTSGRLSVRGSLQRIAGVREELTAAIVEIIFSDLKKIRGVVHITPELENWSITMGKWRPLDKVKTQPNRIVLTREQSGTFEINDND